MNIVIDRKTLLDALNKVSAVIPANSTMNVVLGVLIDADEKVTFVGTDLDRTVYVKKDAQIEEKGGIVIPFKQFLSAVTKFSADEVKIKTVENSVKISCGTAKISIGGHQKEDFVNTPIPDCPNDLKIKDTEFCKMLKLVSFCVDENSTRESLRHILLKVKDKKFLGVGTDGRRLSLYEKDTDVENDMQLLIPNKTLSEIRKFLKLEDKEMTIKYGTASIIFEVEDVVLVSKICLDTFPDYEKVIPSVENLQKKITINKAKLLAAIELVSVMLKNNMVVLFSFFENKMTLSGTDQGSEGSEIVELEYMDERYDIKFNPKFLLDVLKNMDEKDIVMRLNSANPMAPAIVTNEKEYKYIVMPLK